jgi:hypothetical protein
VHTGCASTASTAIERADRTIGVEQPHTDLAIADDVGTRGSARGSRAL